MSEAKVIKCPHVRDDENFHTDGLNVFIDQEGTLLALCRQCGQAVESSLLKDIVSDAVKKVLRENPRGLIIQDG